MPALHRLLLSGFVIILFLAIPSSLLIARDVGERVVKSGNIDDDIYLAGGEVEVDATVNGDVTVAGGELFLDGDIRGDLNAAGGSIMLRSSVSDDARLAGGEIQVFASVGDDLIAAGGRLRLDRDARIGGRAWLSGGDIRVESSIAQELRVRGGRVIIAGEVQGDAHVWAKHIEIGPHAVISGNLFTHSPQEASIAEGARVDGDIQHTATEVSVVPVIAGIIGFALLLLFSTIVSAVVFYLIFPRLVDQSTQSIRENPWPALGIGLAVFAATPVVILILLVTVVGLWLALLLLAAYFILLLLGYLVGVIFIGETGLDLLGKKEPGKAWRIASVVIAVFVLAIVGLIPLLGGLIGWLVLLFGMGALTRSIYLTYNRNNVDASG